MSDSPATVANFMAVLLCVSAAFLIRWFYMFEWRANRGTRFTRRQGTKDYLDAMIRHRQIPQEGEVWNCGYRHVVILPSTSFHVVRYRTAHGKEMSRGLRGFLKSWRKVDTVMRTIPYTTEERHRQMENFPTSGRVVYLQGDFTFRRGSNTLGPR